MTLSVKLGHLPLLPPLSGMICSVACMNALPPTIQPAPGQDSTWRPAVLVAWLVVENDRLRTWVRELEEENARLRKSERQRPRVFL